MADILASGRRILSAYGMDMGAPQEIEQAVRRAIDEGGKERLVLAPSASPHQAHTARFNANALRYLETALAYGRK